MYPAFRQDSVLFHELNKHPKVPKLPRLWTKTESCLNAGYYSRQATYQLLSHVHHIHHSQIPSPGLLLEAVRAALRWMQQIHLGELHLGAEPAVVPWMLCLRRVQGTKFSP